MNQDTIDAQNSVVRCVAKCAPPGWIEFIAHCEIDDDCENLLGSFLLDVEGRLVKHDAMAPGRANYDLYDAFRSLWHAMNREWNSVIVRIDHTGRFKFAFSDALVRLSDNGDLSYNPTTALLHSVQSTYPNQNWESP